MFTHRKNTVYKTFLLFISLVVALSGLGFAFQPASAQAQNPSISIVDVDPGRDVTIRGANFPPNVRFNVRIGQSGTQGVNGIRVATLTIPQSGTFTETFAIPERFADQSRLVVRLDSQESDFFAFNTFATQSGSDGVETEECTEFYTVQRGDTLFEISQRFDTTVDELVALNEVPDRDLVFTGQRLCVDTESVILPPTGANPFVNVVDIDANDVTIQAGSLPANTQFDILIGEAGTQGVNGVEVETVTTPQSGAFVETFAIPEQFSDEERLVVRIEGQGGFFAFTTFQTGGDTDEDEDEDFVEVPGLRLQDPLNERTVDVQFGEQVDLSIGNGGLFTANANFSGALHLARYTSTDVSELRFTQNLLRIELTGPATGGDPVEFVRGLNYVFFDIKEATQALYDIDDLAIYRFDPDRRGWEPCEIMVQIPSEDEDIDRLACVVNEFGVYGIAGQ